MEQIFNPGDGGLGCAPPPPLELPSTISQPPSCSSLSSPDGVKEAIASLVLPADPLLASTWISCSAGFFKLGRIFSVLHGRI